MWAGGGALINPPYWGGPGQARHFHNFKAIVKFQSINAFSKLRRNLPNVFGGGAPLTEARPIGSGQARRDISHILRRSVKLIDLMPLLNYIVI